MTVQTVPAYLQNASHSAAVFRQAVSGAFATGGVLSANELQVAAQTTPNMSVVLGAGRAMVPGTSVSAPTSPSSVSLPFTTQAMYAVLNDASITLTIAASSPTNPRIDAVYVQVQDAFYSGSNNQAIAGVVTGTPAASPVAPAVPSNSLLVAYVAVAANASTIVSGNISQQQVLAAVLPPGNPHFVYSRTSGGAGNFNFTTSSTALKWDPTPQEGVLAGFTTTDQTTFTCTSAGVYVISAQVTIGGGSVPYNVIVQKDGASIKQVNRTGTGNFDSAAAVFSEQFAVGDTFAVFIQCGGSAGTNISGVTGAPTWMSVDRLHG